MIKRTAALLLGAGLIIGGFCEEDKEPLKIEEEVEVPYDQRIGGSGVIEIGLTNLDLDPIRKIVKEDLDKGGFDFSENTFSTVGLIGYAGQRRNGMRVGAGVWAGYNSIYSDKWTTQASDSAISRGSAALIDSIIQLHIIFAHVGLVIERSFKVGNSLNLYAGGMLGGGALIAIEDRKLESGAFNRVDTNTDWESDTLHIENRFAFAPLWAFDFHGGFTYSVTKWMHLGIDGSSLFYYSSGGFQSKYGSFWTVNPGIKLRLVFGTSA
jgi:hypothetical protein